MKCKKCGFDNNLSAQYCAQCGRALKATVEDISAQSQAELKEKKKKRIEQILHMLFIIMCILLVPLVFFCFFLPDPEPPDICIAAPYAEADFTDMFSQQKITFDEKPFLLQLPEASVATVHYITVRTSEQKRDTLVSFFNPDHKPFYPNVRAAAERLAKQVHTKGVWHREEQGTAQTLMVMFALLSQGYSTAHDTMGKTVHKALSSFYSEKTQDMELYRVDMYALLLLAVIENSLMDPKSVYSARIPDMIKKLKSAGSAKGKWKTFFSGKKSGAPDHPVALCAARTVLEARSAGLCLLREDEKAGIASSMKELLTEEESGNEKQLFLRRSWALYNYMLCCDYSLPGTAQRVLRQNIRTVLTKDVPPSLLGAHFLLLTLHRTGDRRYGPVLDKLMNVYKKSFDRKKACWPADNKHIVYVSNADDIVTTAIIVRTFALPYLFPRSR